MYAVYENLVVNLKSIHTLRTIHHPAQMLPNLGISCAAGP
jgi:hypothetical protein